MTFCIHCNKNKRPTECHGILNETQYDEQKRSRICFECASKAPTPTDAIPPPTSTEPPHLTAAKLKSCNVTDDERNKSLIVLHTTTNTKRCKHVFTSHECLMTLFHDSHC